jgi:DNA-binding transcriptional regulator YhcF (GntR family)
MRRLENQRCMPSIRLLAEDYRVHPRTIRRDLEVLETIGVRLPNWRHRESDAA